MPTRFTTRLREFFYQEETPYALAVVRVLLPLALLSAAIPRWLHVREIYSTDGATAPLWLNYGHAAILPEPSAPVAVALYSILLFCLATTSLGWMTRVSLAVVTILYPYFGILDSMGTLTKYTALATHALLLLTLSGCGSIWSIDAWLRRRRVEPGATAVPMALATRHPVWPRRLLQLLIGIVYLGAAFTKMHTPAYFSGDQLVYWMLANANFANPVGEFLSQRPSLLIIGAYATILWETLFVFLAWKGTGRVLMLGLGVAFHVLTALTLGLLVFPLVCLAIYPIFLEDHECVRMRAWVGSWLPRFSFAGLIRWGRPVTAMAAVHQGSPDPERQWDGIRPAHSSMAFAVVSAAVIVLGVEAEYRLDVYGERRGGERLSLRPIDEELIRAMLAPERPLRPQDLYFSFDIGTELVGGTLSDRRAKFRHGERAVAQCSLHPPHPDMWLEVVLQDTENQIVHEVGKVVPREELRADFVYSFAPVLPPGEYDFVLRYAGEEMTRRRVVLVGESTVTASR